MLAPTPRVISASSIRPIKPRGFRPVGTVGSAEFQIKSPFGNPRRGSPAQRRGRSYEAKVLAELEDASLFKLFTPSPWIVFDDGDKRRLCQPDALAFGSGSGGDWLLILEVKLRHNIMAYWQLRKLYQPVLVRMFPGYEVRVCEITKGFDPATPWPEDIRLLQDVTQLLELKTQEFGVLQWRI